MLRSVLIALTAFAACFIVGTGLQVFFGLPAEQFRRHLLVGLVTSAVVGAFAFFYSR